MNSQPLAPAQLLTVAQLARAWQVSRFTIRLWARQGLIEGAQKLRPGAKKSSWRFRPDSKVVATAAPMEADEALQALLAWRPRRVA